MITIRNNVFETNSSSTHTITISSDNYIDKNLHYRDNVINIYFGEFGWEVEKYTDFYSRASYAITLCKYDENKFNQVVDMISSYFDGLKVLVIQTNGVSIESYDELDIDFAGYVDHQSWDESHDEIFTSSESLYDFLFSDNSYFNTDNDNH